MRGCRGFNSYRIEDDLAIIDVVRGDGSTYHIFVDSEDIQRLVDRGRRIGISKYGSACYAVSSEPNYGKQVYLHRLILNYNGELHIDHINGNGLDNRKSNLRLVNHSQNAQNRKGAQSNSKSGIRGVSWKKNKNRWVAHVNGKDIGYYKYIEDAEAAAIAARAELMTHSAESSGELA